MDECGVPQRVWCLTIDIQQDNFPIYPKEEDVVHDLKESIYKELNPASRPVSPALLTLWKPKIFIKDRTSLTGREHSDVADHLSPGEFLTLVAAEHAPMQLGYTVYHSVSVHSNVYRGKHAEKGRDILKSLPRAYNEEIRILQHFGKYKTHNKHTIPSDTGVHAPQTIMSHAKQLLEGVAFLHAHRLAHRDLKPDNIVVDHTTGRLFVIDYGLAAWVDAEDDLVSGYVGTEGWTAPEVGEDNGRGERRSYSAFRADAWTCGRVLKRLAFMSEEKDDADSAQPAQLRAVYEYLLQEEPTHRPSVAMALLMLSPRSS
ncbi:hypothetical protein BOTBODRAFT_170902 [Botryobasidium botryosum FD-172 SS1]|uniref:non-specific serine/threonine protein kinase n=1 Tax=Botryobasidium botryosum (strain FD-172 SS1) TaxID=930990 RepID=A0A067N585_BOTB1|nr:hypothetical protein BOTBODRAFT_170902 [Botryobasidium botryosum FD-172 SS1]